MLMKSLRNPQNQPYIKLAICRTQTIDFKIPIPGPGLWLGSNDPCFYNFPINTKWC